MCTSEEKTVYICIPWRSTFFGRDSGKETRKVAKDTRVYDHLSKRSWDHTLWTSWTSDTTVVEQDLSVTMEKTLAINKAIRELYLAIPSELKRSNFSWQTAIDRQEGGFGDERWPSVYSEEHGKLWTPKVLAVLQAKLDI